MSRIFLTLALSAAITFAAEPPEVPAGFVIEKICEGLDAAVTMDVARDGRVFFTEQLGAVRVIEKGKLLDEPFVRVEADDYFERGVEGVALHPNFPAEPFVYVHYVRKQPHPAHIISRFTAAGPTFNTAQAGSELVMSEGENQDQRPAKARGAHQGGAMRFGADGKLYATIGEHTTREPSQALDSLFGKVLRFNPDGSIPSDNPFFADAKGEHRAIWATGLRNPFGLAVQPGTGRIFVNDPGQELFEEIDELKRGANYGWPKAEGLVGHLPEFEKPLHTYNRVLGACIAGGAFVPEKGAQFPPEFAGKFIFADYSAGWLRVLDPANPEKSVPFATRIPNPTDVAFAPDGSLLVLARAATLHDGNMKRRTGMLLRIRGK